jgi:hypothetical protein
MKLTLEIINLRDNKFLKDNKINKSSIIYYMLYL